MSVSLSTLHTTFSSNIPFYDRTGDGFHVQRKALDFYSKKTADFIAHGNARVYWNNERGAPSIKVFSKENGTEAVAIEKGEKKGHYRIVEYRIDADEYQWEFYTHFRTPFFIGRKEVAVYRANPIISSGPSDPVTRSIVAEFPVNTSRLSAKQIEVLDKKVSGVAMTSEEEAAHLANLSEKVDLVVHQGSKRKFHHELGDYSTAFEEKLKRRHIAIDDHVKLYDCTEKGIASFEYDPATKMEHIALNHVPIALWNLDGSPIPVTFSRTPPNYSNFIVVHDGRERNSVDIVEHECSRNEGLQGSENHFHIHLNEIKKGKDHSGVLSHTKFEGPIYIAKGV